VALALAFALVGLHARSAAPAGENVDVKEAPVGAPFAPATKAKPWIIDLTTPPAMAGGKPVIVKVTINDLAAIKPGETFSQASKRKAEAVAAEVNAALGAGRATVTQKMVDVITGYTPVRNARGIIIRYDPIIMKMEQSFITITGLYTIPAKNGKPGTPAYVQKTNPTLEFGDGANLVPGSSRPMGAPGYGASMGGSGLSATGLNPMGEQSFVDFGIDGKYVAGVLPTDGESDSQILQELGRELDQHKIFTTFDYSEDTLVIDSVIPSTETVDWANTDTGLDFSVALIGVPEPAAWLLLIAGFGLAGAALRRRRAPALAPSY
jgi:hypothetical protein